MKTLKEVCIITGISVIGAFGVNSFSPNGIALVGQWDTSQGVISAIGKNDVVMEELEIDDVTHAKTLYDTGQSFLSMHDPSKISMKAMSKGRYLFRWGNTMIKLIYF